MRKEADGEAVLRQQEEIDDLRSGMRSALPGVGYGTCGAFGWNPRNKVMLGEDAEVMVAYQMFKRSMENIAEKYEMEFQDSLYTLGLHLVVFHYKFNSSSPWRPLPCWQRPPPWGRVRHRPPWHSLAVARLASLDQPSQCSLFCPRLLSPRMSLFVCISAPGASGMSNTRWCCTRRSS